MTTEEAKLRKLEALVERYERALKTIAELARDTTAEPNVKAERMYMEAVSGLDLGDRDRRGISVATLIDLLSRENVELPVMAGLFFGPGSPTAELYPLDPTNFRPMGNVFVLTVNVPDRLSKESLRRRRV